MIDKSKGFAVELTGTDDTGIYGVKTLVVTHNGREILRQSDDIEPEKIRFHRGLAWVPEAIRQAYQLGRDDVAAEGQA